MNLFLYTFADANKLSLENAREKIIRIVFKNARIRLQRELRYSIADIKVEFDNIVHHKMQGVFDNGKIEIEGKEYDLNKYSYWFK